MLDKSRKGGGQGCCSATHRTASSCGATPCWSRAGCCCPARPPAPRTASCTPWPAGRTRPGPGSCSTRGPGTSGTAPRRLRTEPLPGQAKAPWDAAGVRLFAAASKVLCRAHPLSSHAAGDNGELDNDVTAATSLARPRNCFQQSRDDAPVDRMSLRYDRLVSTSVKQTSTSRAAPPAPASSADNAWSRACAPQQGRQTRRNTPRHVHFDTS